MKKETSVQIRQNLSQNLSMGISPKLYNPIWLFNLFFLTISLSAITRQFGWTFMPGLIAGILVSGGLYYLQRSRGEAVSFMYSLKVNIVVLFIGILTAVFFLWNNLLIGEGLNIVEHTVILFFLLGLSSIGILLRIITSSYGATSTVEERIKEIMGGPSLLLSFCVAAIIACLTMLIFHTLDQNGLLGFLKVKFLQRGIIPPLCLVLFYWESILLLGKYQLSINNITMKNILNNKKSKTKHSPLMTAWHDYSKSYASAKKTSAEAVAKRFVDIAWQANETFYFFPRYINWAIPILGFIGTVLGISLAASEIGNIVESSNLNIGDSINSAMEPLGIAFDTTLIALSLSVFLAFIYTVLQRWEEQKFLFIEEYITHNK